jgi:outer membrane protein assembly factor BamB
MANGHIRWQRNFPGGIDSSATVADGVIYFGDGNNNVHALAVNNGATIWTYQSGNTMQSSPVAVNGVVYVGSAVSDGNGSLCVLRTNGQLVTAYQTGAQVRSSPVLADGWAYVGSDNDEVLAVKGPSS